ncbi:YveK family protein [Cellulosilyticum ruminicola]|uniref:YveK family protein n=1 Tax=Cellulosilyticum ruminicola TaxID=425254 RepID=UPI0006D1F9B3|nr:Wzz/FepE/Etk N-terminal domain-containing protein [Cellulosilyticum ruminicola]
MENIEISLFDIVFRILKRWYIILACGILTGGLTYSFVSKNIHPTYTGVSTLYAVSNDDIELLTKGISNITQAKEIVTTYTQMMTTDRVLNKVIETGKLDYTASQLRGMIATYTTKGSPFITLTVTSGSEEDTLNIINTMVEIVPQEIYDVLRVGYVEAIDTPTAPLTPYMASPWKKVLIGGGAGAIIPLVIILIYALFDTKIRNINNLVNIYELTVLGTIPTIQNGKVAKGK